MRILAFLPLFAFAYLPPAPNCLMPGPDQMDVYCTLDFLYWESSEQGLEYAFKNKSGQTSQELTIYQTHPNWEPAFKVGLGGHLPHDNWDFGLTYTFFRTTSEDSTKHNFVRSDSPGPGLIATWIAPTAFSDNGVGVRFSYASANWKLFAQMLDGMLSRSFQIGKQLDMTSGFGLRSAWIHQNYSVSYTGGNTIPNAVENFSTVLGADVSMGNFSNNFGPMIFLASKWRLAEQWDICGSLSGSLLASYFHVFRKESDTSTNLVPAVQQEFFWLKNKYWAFCPQGQLSFGVRFGDCITTIHRSIYYSIGASYEAQIFWKQNQLLRYVDAFEGAPLTASVVPTQGDLIFQGLTVDFHMDF